MRFRSARQMLPELENSTSPWLRKANAAMAIGSVGDPAQLGAVWDEELNARFV